MRVLVIAKDFPSEGRPDAGVFVLRQIQALARLGFEFRVVRVVPHAPAWTEKWRHYRAIPPNDVVDGIGVETIRAIMPPRMLGFEYLPLQVDGPIRKIVAGFRPDVIQGHFLVPSGQLAVRYGVPSVITAHGSDAYDWVWRRPGLQRAARQAISGASAVVAVSDFVRDKVRALYDRDVHVIHNGADESLFGAGGQTAARRKLGIAADRFVVSFVGHAGRVKGAFDLIDAVARLGDLRPMLLLAGPDPGKNEELRIAAAESRADVRLCGTLEQRAVAEIVAASNVFCLPSYREGLPAVVCEAMLSGRPVIATHVGGIPEIVTEGVTGYLVSPGNVELLSKQVRALAENPALAILMGEKGRAFARRHLTWTSNAAAYATLFARAANAAA